MALQSMDSYQQWLASLATLPELEAEDNLKVALSLGCEKITLARAGVRYSGYQEHLHHYFVCESCQHSNPSIPIENEDILLLSSQEICDETRTLVADLFEKYESLSKMINEHEPLIRRRWLKKSQGQRKAILVKAWPSIPETHRPDLDNLILDACPHKRDFRVFEKYLWPYINLEDMLKPKSLLIFLNSRGRHKPDKFAHADLELAPLWKASPEALESRQDNRSMKFIGEEDRKGYGALIEWENKPQAVDSIQNGNTMHLVHGWQILKIQCGIWDFLVKCCSNILHDMPSPPLTPRIDNAATPSEHEPPLLSDNNESYSALDVVAREAPYRLPARLDFGRLRALVSAQRDQAEDHIWALREDPGYFAEVVREHREHRRELIAGECCGTPEADAQDHILYGHVLRSVITDAYTELFTWHELLRRISTLRDLMRQHADAVQPGHEFPEQYSELLVRTQFFLEAMMLDLIHQFKKGWPASPPVRTYYRRDCDQSHKSCETVLVHKSTKFREDQNKATQRVGRIIAYLSEKRDRDFLTLHTVMEVLERFLQDSPEAKSLISPWLASYLSQLSVVSECLHQFHLHQPLAHKVQRIVKERQIPLFIEYATMFSPWNQILKTDFHGTKLIVFGNPTKRRFDYPVHKRRSCDNVRLLRAAEAALDVFWKAADEHFLKNAGKSPHDLVRDIVQERTLQRTPPWVEPTKSDRLSQRPTDYVYHFMAEVYHDPSKQITGVFSKLSVANKSKSKSRGIAAPIENPEPQPQPEVDQDQQPTFRLEKRAYRVFMTLFHSPNSPDQPGDIPWAEFLHAMVSAGFSAEKLQSSAWQFTPRNLDVERPIQFHEPHPSSKLPFTWARRFGRRLSRAYGWRGDMFRLA